MHAVVHNQYDLVHELRPDANLASVPLHSELVTSDITELVEETYIRGILSDKLPLGLDELHAHVDPVWKNEPLVEKVAVRLTVGRNGNGPVYAQSYAAGRWVRSAQLADLRLWDEGALVDSQVVHRMLIGLKRSDPPHIEMPTLEPPPIVDQSLKDFGIRQLGLGQLVSDRPVLVNQRMSADTVRCCEEADTTETGSAVLGKILRLDQPLPGTQTRLVTVLSATVDDPRHQGAPLSFTFSPEGLAQAAQFADLRGLGKTVQTVFHSHGWSKACGNCNHNANCPLAECNPSLQDYQLLESLFSSKATLLPIAGRRLGEPGRRPVLQIHAWRGGEMRPIRWQEYSE